MWGVIGGDAVDHSRAQAVDQREAIALAAQWGIHLEAGVQRQHRLVGQRQVVRRNLRTHRYALALDALDRRHGLGGGQVEEVAAGILVASDGGVPLDHRALRHRRDSAEAEHGRHAALVHDASSGEARVLLVQGDDATGEALVLQRPSQHRRAFDRNAVVGKADGALVRELCHLGQLVTRLPLGRCSEKAHRDARLEAGSLFQGREHRRVVDDRIGVRHGKDAREPAGRRCTRAGVEVLLVLATGSAKVHVGVDEARKQVEALGLDDLGPGRRVDRPWVRDLGYAALAHEQVGHAADTGSGIEQQRRAKEDARRLALPHRELRAGQSLDLRHSVHAGCFAVGSGTPTGAPFSLLLVSSS